MDQETMLKASFLERQTNELEQYLEFIDSQINELELFKENLAVLSTSEEKEILSSLGKGVFLKGNMTEKKLFVEVGSGVVLRKTPEEAGETISFQVKRLKELRIQGLSQLDSTRTQLSDIMEEMEKHFSKKE